MTKQEAAENVRCIKNYLCAGNPIWDKSLVAETLDMAIAALLLVDESDKRLIPLLNNCAMLNVRGLIKVQKYAEDILGNDKYKRKKEDIT